MPWVKRGSRRYFYQSVRRKGRPIRVYLGSGPQAETAAAEIEARRQQRRDQAEALLLEEKNHGDAVAPLEDLCRLTDLLTRTTLIALGYQLHARSEWRKRRVTNRPDPSQGVPGSPEESAGAGPCG